MIVAQTQQSAQQSLLVGLWCVDYDTAGSISEVRIYFMKALRRARKRARCQPGRPPHERRAALSSWACCDSAWYAQAANGHSAGASTKTASGPPWTPSLPLPLVRRLFSFRHTSGGVRVAHGAPPVAAYISDYCTSTNAALARALPFELRSSALLPVG